MRKKRNLTLNFHPYGRKITFTLYYSYALQPFWLHLFVTYSLCWALNDNFFPKAPFTRYNLLSNPLSNRWSNWFANRLYRVYKHSTGCQTRLTTGFTNGCIVYTAGCQTGCTTRIDNRLNEQWLFVQHGYQTGCQTGLYNRFDNRLERTVCSFNTVVKPVVKPGCTTSLTTGLTTGWMFVHTIQPVVNLVVQPVWQPVVSCKRGLTNWLQNGAILGMWILNYSMQFFGLGLGLGFVNITDTNLRSTFPG